jgi:hypothetical protein
MWKGGPPYLSTIVGTVADPNPDKPELKIEDLLMSLRSVLFKIEN